jgi:O-antigen ligase
LDYPLFGCGVKNFEEIAKKYRKPRDVPYFGLIDIGVSHGSYSHNVFLTILAEQGALGIIPFALIFVLIFHSTQRAYRVLPRDGLVSRDLVVCGWAAMAAYFANAFLIEMRQFEYINVLLFFLLGIIVGAQDHFAEKQAPTAKQARVPVPWPTAVRAARPR